MKNQRTRHALLMSMMSILLCVAMLIGSTFAWFTDTASTNVNQIKSGTLKLDIVDAADEAKSLKGGTLEFVKAADAPDGEAVLWEPGATYNLTPFKIVNKGNLALKYKVTVNGGTGDTELLNVINFTVKEGDNTVANSLDGWTGNLAGEAKSGTITISGTMNTAAGNEYQTKTLDGISITVTATQDTVEFDSIDNEYDAKAEYPIVETISTPVTVEDKAVKAEVKLTSTNTVTVNGDATPVVTATIPEGVTLAENATAVTLSVKEDATTTPNIEAVDDADTVKNFNIEVAGVAEDNKTKITVTVYVGTGLVNPVVYHNGEAMATEDYNYDANTGILTIRTATFSPFTLVAEEATAKIDTTYYNNLHEAILAATDGQTVYLLKDSSGSGLETLDSGSQGNITVDFGGHTYTMINSPVGSSGTENQAMHWGNGATSVTLKNGKFVVAANASGVKFIMQCHINFIAESMTFDGASMGVYYYDEYKYKVNYPAYYMNERPTFNCDDGKDMTLTNCIINLPAASTKGVYIEDGTMTLTGTTINGYACIAETNGKIVKDSASTVTKGIVPYFDGYAVNSADDGDNTVYTVALSETASSSTLVVG